MTDSGVPSQAQQRLRGLRRAGHAGGVFTAATSVDEFLVVRRAGFEPVGLCVGSCIHHVGIQPAAWTRNQEMKVLSQALFQARSLALNRMRDEAQLAGADGVLGVRLRAQRLDWDANLLEFVALGTAVAHARGQARFRGRAGKPFVADVSGEAFSSLLQGGYRPIDLVMGSCVYHLAHRGASAGAGQVGQNVELTAFTQALYDARGLAMERMQYEAAAAGAEGVIGVALHEEHHAWPAHVTEFFAIGTAVTPIAAAVP